MNTQTIPIQTIIDLTIKYPFESGNTDFSVELSKIIKDKRLDGLLFKNDDEFEDFELPPKPMYDETNNITKREEI